MKREAAIAAALVAAFASVPARAERPRVYAITGGKLVISPGKVIEGGTVVLRDGLIESAGKDVKVPPDAVTVDATGKTVHAGFIDACSEVGLRKGEGEAAGAGSAQGGGGRQRTTPQAAVGAAHPITRVRPERRALDQLSPGERELEKHRGMGFTDALVAPGDGILRGTSALVSLGDGSVSENVVRADVAQHVGFDHGSWNEGYPGSLMGAIAAIRQGFEDARRHELWESRYEADPRGMKRPDTLTAYEPLARAASGKIPVFFDADTPENVLRAFALASEFGLDAGVIGSGNDYEVTDEIRAAGRPLILSMAFRDKPDIDDADDTLDVETRDLERFLGVRVNPGRLAAAGIHFSIGTCRMKNVADFPSNLRKAIDAGLKPDDALAALTTEPARLFGLERSMGTLEPGKAANVVIEDGELFAEKTKPVRVYVDGTEYLVEEKKPKGDPNAKVDPRGTWSVTITIRGNSYSRTWTISGEKDGPYEGTAETREGTVSFTSIKLLGNEMTAVLPSPGGGAGWEATVIITGDGFEGTGEGPGGGTISLRATRTSGPPGGGSGFDAAETGSEDEPYSCARELEEDLR